MHCQSLHFLQYYYFQVGVKDEAYPFMMTERRRGRIGSLGDNENRIRRPLSTSPPGGHFSQVKRTRTMSLDEDVPEDAAVTSRRSKRLGSDSAIHRFRGSRKSPFGSTSSSLGKINLFFKY